MGRYQIVRRLGAGGMGVVFAARDGALDRMVALKLVRRADDPGADARLAREARALAKLTHPNVVTVYDVGTHADGRFIAMELVEGETLHRWLERAPRSWREIVRTFVDAGRGLAATHAAGLIHRDFKPDNVLLDPDGRARVTDFGLARVVDDTDAATPEAQPGPPTITRDGALVGTPAYMSPEQLLGRPIDERADQFSFFVALYEALAAQRPFGRESPPDEDALGALVAEITGGRPQAPPGPSWLARVVLRGLEPDARRRFPSMSAVVATLERGLGRRRRRILAGLAVAVAAAMTWVLVARRPAPGPELWQPIPLARAHPDASPTQGFVSKDGAHLFFASATEVWSLPRGGGPRRTARLPDGSEEVTHLAAPIGGRRAFVAIVRGGRREIWELDLATGTRTLRVPTDRTGGMRNVSANFLDVSPDGEALIFDATASTADGEARATWRLDAAGRLRRLGEPVDESDYLRAHWSPYEPRIARARLPASEVDIIDADSGRILETFKELCVDLAWLTPRSLACGRTEEARVVVWEIALEGGRERSKRHVGPEYEALAFLQATPAGVFLETCSLEQQLTLFDPDSGVWAPVRTGAVTDTHVAGWTRDGSMIFGAQVAGRLSPFRRAPGGTLELIQNGPVAEIPLVVLGDDIIYGRFPDGEKTFPYNHPAAGEVQLLRRTLASEPVALGSSHQLTDVMCAGDRSPPCYLAEMVDSDVRAVEWDPVTGTRGREVARWAGGGIFETPALSADGRRLARVSPEGQIEVIDLGGGPPARVPCRECATPQFLTWDPNGDLLVTAFERGYRLLRVRSDGTSVVLFRSASTWLKEPRVAPDGRTVAILTADMSMRYSWVPAPAH